MMKRTLLIVAILALSVAPAMAAVTVRAIQEVPSAAGAGYSATRACNVVDINYTCDASERVRAFAIEVNVDNGFIISNVSDYNKGESSALTGSKTGYGIFPGSFRDVITPASPNWVDSNYKPIAPATDGTDANGTGLGTHKVILEMGSLYVGDTNKPLASGTLCRLWITPPRPAMDCNLTIAVNTTRGGVVLEDGTAVTPTLVARGLVAASKVSFPDCFPCWTPYDVTYTEFLGNWKPNCWCGQYAVADATRSYQCYGDADGKTEGSLTKYRVYTSDYAIMAAAWSKKSTQLKSLTNGFCADFDHKFEGSLTKYRVYTSDYSILASNWMKKDTQLKTGGMCPK